MPFIARWQFSQPRIFALLTGAFFIGSLPAVAVGDLNVTPSGNDLTLSFPTTPLRFYALQASPDLLNWTNSLMGVPGDGTMKSVTMSNAISGGQSFYRYLVQEPTQLSVPQSTAFEILGYSCGGIKEEISAGFDIASGFPSGVVNLSTTCSGSGRDGGHSTTHTASAVVTWDLSGNVTSAIPLTNGVSVNPTTGADGLGDFIFTYGTAAYLIVPQPASPIFVTAVQSGDQFDVSWAQIGGNQAAVLSSTLTAVPVNSTAAVLTTSVAGSATNGAILTLEPRTTYQITVVSRTLGGFSPISSPITATTSPATVPPSAPSGVAALWSNPDPSSDTNTLVPSWQPADPGNSPVDEYQINISGSDGGGTFTQTVSGTTLTTFFTVNDIPNWSVTVQAHNAAGWGPVSSIFNLGGQ